MSDAHSLLETAGLRITQPRLQIARTLFADGLDRHVTAEQVFARLKADGVHMALATVYNTLGHFVEAGLLRPISKPGSDASIYDTNTSSHHHFLNETTGELTDIPAGAIPLDLLPQPEDGSEIVACELVIRTRSK
ncbi:Fur family transcriptional regulator [Hyphobacterium sp. HN65]|uniref:Ferric uptake regulation protein n=1 Tax=Hyphobacterium lacteum TaxID=3116575 RepID=A0ABU7LQ03_9PROT|nr:Fur family transcriptional regulator [Hyphobacterium sp. HN65]MEE2525669.1 Fur family transcriptional regulator [Hyphobacterium sp. HN65]